MSEKSLYRAIAAELRAAGLAIEALAARLCAVPGVAASCLDDLQQFDRLAQHQCELAALLLRLSEGSGAHDALAAVRVEGLAARLADRS